MISRSKSNSIDLLVICNPTMNKVNPNLVIDKNNVIVIFSYQFVDKQTDGLKGIPVANITTQKI